LRSWRWDIGKTFTGGGNASVLNAPVTEGAVSSTLCHLGNIATRVGRKLNFDGAKCECAGDDEANQLLTREYRKGYELPDIHS